MYRGGTHTIINTRQGDQGTTRIGTRGWTKSEVAAVSVITISRGCFERCCSNKKTPPYHSNLSFVTLRTRRPRLLRAPAYLTPSEASPRRRCGHASRFLWSHFVRHGLLPLEVTLGSASLYSCVVLEDHTDLLTTASKWESVSWAGLVGADGDVFVVNPTYIYIYVCVCIHIYMYSYVYIYVYIYVYVYLAK